VFAGGCTLQAVETVCSGEGIDPGAVFELLASLVARSLVVAEESGPVARSHGRIVPLTPNAVLARR
jgi:predicted ATPase